ncbi:MAG: hypothetical protein K5880_08545 [Hydrogenophaga sp.]|uniref:PilC/PilY family type IV pilus protein n=1 Tax=Hydrogenophaga sp. TaxID=1904254 RepID=UPI0026196BD4|nr:PilC/PilY family type IV pilus protein [Hydrogenophaga sp.]MCV0438669.1 hypothetical protein [Hydrogenophaga sp.]
MNHTVVHREKDARHLRSLLRTLFASGLLLIGALSALPQAQAQNINDVPMAVKNNVAPNFMFMIDNSGSMSNIVPEAPYNAANDYTPSSDCAAGNRISAGTSVDLRIATAGGQRRSFIRYGGNNYRHSTQTPTGTFGTAAQRCFVRNSLYPARLLADSNSNTEPSGYLASEYTGNYLNWYFSTACSATNVWSGTRKPIDSCSGSVQTRMEVAKASAKLLVDALPVPTSASPDYAVRIGLSTYYSGDGGTLLSPIKNLSATATTNTATEIGRTPFKTLVDALSPSGNTPLAETLADIGRYLATGYNDNIATANTSSVNIDAFFEQNSRDSCLRFGSSRNGCTSTSVSSTNQATQRPITQWCQRSYVFMLTDGRSQGDQAFSDNAHIRDYDRDCSGALASTCVSNGASGAFDRKLSREYESQGSDYLDDVAKALFDIDLRPDITKPAPPVTTPPTPPYKNNALTYVIGFADTQVQNDPLLIAAGQQGGGDFIAASDQTELTRALTELTAQAFAKDAASAAVAVANAQLTVNNVSYAPSYNSGTWYGDLEAFALDTTTGAPVAGQPAFWSARVLLNGRTPASRRIATFNGTTGVPFQPGFTGAPASLTTNVINFLRGDRSLEDGVTVRRRAHVLGDLINAKPVVLNYPGNIPIIFQAANDGMLHVFDGRTDGSAGNGQELWAYVPRAVHNNLSELADPGYNHRYFLDSTPATAEVTGVGAISRLLVGGLGKGGGAYYALNVSSYLASNEGDVASKVLWELKDARTGFNPVHMGYSFGTPQIVRTAAGWRVVVTSGYGNGTGGPNGNGDGVGRVWVLNPETGNVEGSISTGVGTAASPSGLAHLSRVANSAPGDTVRFLYGGDLLGNVWRFDLDAMTTARVATARDSGGTVQPITSPVEVGRVTGSTTQFHVYVGTGRYLADEDVPGNTGANVFATQRQSMYGFIDDTTNSSPTVPNIRGTNGSTCPAGGGNGELVCQSLSFVSARGSYAATTHVVPTDRRGWYIDFPQDTRLTNGRVTGKPVLTPRGTLAFVVNIPTAVKCDPGGSSWFFTVSGETGGAVPVTIGGSDYYDVGVFVANALSSEPTLVFTEDGVSGVLQTSNKEIRSLGIPEPTTPVAGPASWRRIYWRQLK